jgi:hypothetical protein
MNKLCQHQRQESIAIDSWCNAGAITKIETKTCKVESTEQKALPQRSERSSFCLTVLSQWRAAK